MNNLCRVNRLNLGITSDTCEHLHHPVSLGASGVIIVGSAHQHPFLSFKGNESPDGGRTHVAYKTEEERGANGSNIRQIMYVIPDV